MWDCFFQIAYICFYEQVLDTGEALLIAQWDN